MGGGGLAKFWSEHVDSVQQVIFKNWPGGRQTL